MKPETKKEILLWGGVGVGAIVIYVAVNKQPNPTPTPTTRGGIPQRQTGSGPTTQPNPQQLSIDQAFLAARDTAIQAYDQTVLGEQSNRDQLIAMNNQTQAAKVIAFKQYGTQLKLGTLQTTAAEQIAQEQTAAQEQIAQTQAQAYQQAIQSQQPQWWQYLLGGLSTVGSFFTGGFSGLFGGGGTGFSPTMPSYDPFGQPNVQSPLPWNVIG